MFVYFFWGGTGDCTVDSADNVFLFSSPIL